MDKPFFYHEDMKELMRAQFTVRTSSYLHVLHDFMVNESIRNRLPPAPSSIICAHPRPSVVPILIGLTAIHELCGVCVFTIRPPHWI